MEGFDIEAYIKDSTEKSGVPLKVSEPSTLMSVASQLKGNMSKSSQDETNSIPKLGSHKSVHRRPDRGLSRAPLRRAE